MASVLVVDDERSMREFLQILLESEGHDVTTADGYDSAISTCEELNPELVFTDLRLPDGSGMDVLSHVRKTLPETQVIIMTAFATAENAIEAMRLGAYDYQTKPVKVDEIRVLTQKALEKVHLIRNNQELSAQLRGRFGLSHMVGSSPAMVRVAELIEKVAPTRTNVLVQGESGTGKELVARAVHEGSQRGNGPFIAVNCGAIPDTLIESELFGHASGTFTGATKARRGLFEAAQGGTLFLDEIGELPQPMQVKLLRALQERKVRRLGEERERTVDVRIVAATNRDLQQSIARGEFREDLFYRLNVVRILVPALRERSEDIPLLAKVFVERFGKEAEKDIQGISDNALAALSHYAFPGNVRELENYMERAVTLAVGQTIELDDLPDEVRLASGKSNDNLLAFPAGGVDLEKLLLEIERRFILQALERCEGVKTRAAELLGLSFRSFRYRVKKLGLQSEDDAG